MKRALAGILLLAAMSIAPALAYDGDGGQRSDIRRDESRITHERREQRRDFRNDNYVAARHERREVRRDYRDRDRRDVR
jgi:hypothetical protein